MIRLTRLLFVILVVSLFFGTLALGGVKSRVQRVPLHPVVVTGEYVGDCGDFLILNDYTLIVRGMFQLDKDGNPVKVVELYSNTYSIYYNSEDPSIVVAGEETNGLLKSDFGDNTMKVCGDPYKITVPGYGVVFHQVGCWTWDMSTWEVIDYKGPHDIFEGNLEGLCHLLRGPE